MIHSVSENLWPHGKTSAAIISVIFDDGLDAIEQAPDLESRSKSFSVWQYGATRGVERLCNAFASHNVTSSWFVPGSLVAKHKQLLRDVISANHQLESHGWAFERYDQLDRSTAINMLRRSRETLSAIASRDVSGFRLPAGDWPQHFDQTLLEAGYTWSASLNGDDLPYRHPSSLVEIPVHIELEDRPYFQFNFTPAFPKGQGRIPSYEAVLENWISEFNAYRKYGLCYVLQLRPEWSGTPGRIGLVEKLLAHIRSFDDVWLTTAASVAAWSQEKGARAPKEHPINIYYDYVREEEARER